MEMYNPTPWWKRNFSLRYRRCNHQWEKITDYIDEGEQWYQVYCAKCETMMFFSKVGIQKLNRINEIREEYGETGARRHFFMFETEGDVVEKKQDYEAQGRKYFDEVSEAKHKAALVERQAEESASKQDYYNEIVRRRMEAEKHRRDLEELASRVEEAHDVFKKIEMARLHHRLTFHCGSNGRGDANDEWHYRAVHGSRR